MADSGLFIGWGQVVRGREKRAVEVFNEAVDYWGSLESEGRIESFEVVMLTPHGGDLDGFALLRGSREQVAALREAEDFEQQITRADLIVDNQGVVQASLGEGIARSMSTYNSEVDALD